MGSSRWCIARVHLALVVLCALLVASAAASAQMAPSVAAEIDALAAKMYPTDGPAAAIIVAKAGAPVYRKAFGMADDDGSVKAVTYVNWTTKATWTRVVTE